MSLHGGNHDRTRNAFATIGEEQTARIGNADQAVLGHLEQPQLIGGAEPVFRRAQQPQSMVPVALEGEHGVDDMLEHAWTGEPALLGDMTHQHDGQITGFGDSHQAGGTLTNLRHRPRG